MTSLWNSLLLPLRDFISEDCHAKFGGKWATYKGETEGGGAAYIITKVPLPK